MAKKDIKAQATINAASTVAVEEGKDMMNMTVKELRAAAKEAGIKGYSKMNKTDLIAAIEAAKAVPVAEDKAVIGNAQEIPEDIFDAIDGAHEVTGNAVPVEAPDLSVYADDNEEVPSCFTDDPVVAPEKASEAKAKKERSFKGVAMKDMNIDQLRDKMAADMAEFRFIEDERVRRSKMGNEIISGAKKTDGFIDRNLLESIVAKYQYGITGYLILKKNSLVPQDIIDNTQKILAGLLQHWVLGTKVLKVAAFELRDSIDGVACKGSGFRHETCTHPLCQNWRKWQEVDPADWKKIMDSKKYRYMVFQVNVGGSDTTTKTAPAQAETSKEEKMAKFMEERNAVWKTACEQFNGMLSIPTGDNRTTPYRVQQKVTGLLKINGTWIARVSSQWDTFYAYDMEYKRFYGTDPMKTADYADRFHHVMNKKNA